MRKAFVKTLIDLAERDENVYLLTGDLGFGVFEDFIKRFPGRFLNCGVAEQNMIGVAAGLALSGKKPYVYSIVPFVTMRCFEQIRNDLCYQNLDVKIIGTGSGFSYGELGATHYGLEDIAVLRSLPNMVIFSPADPLETEELILKSYQIKNPSYIRLARSGEPLIHKNLPQLEIGKPLVLKEGEDGAVIATGSHQVGAGLEAVEKLKELGYHFKMINLHTLKPIDKEALLKELKDIKKVFTIEEHNKIGGLGSAVAEILAESDWQGKLKIIAVPDEYPSEIGGPDYLRRKYFMAPEQIIDTIFRTL